MHAFARIAALSVAAGLLLTQLASIGRAPDGPVAPSQDAASGLAIHGTGSTFAAPLFKKWMASFGARTSSSARSSAGTTRASPPPIRG